MTLLLALVLAAPLVAAVAVVVRRDQAFEVARFVALATAAGWVALVAAADPESVTLGRLVVDPVTAAAAAGLALLVGAAPPTSAWATSASLSGVTLFATAGSAGDGAVPDRPLAAGMAVLAALAAVRFRATHTPLPGAALVVAAGLVSAVGLTVSDPERAAVLVIGGCGGIVIAVAVWSTPGLLLFPAAVLAAGRTSAAVDIERADVDVVAVVGALVGLVAAIGLARSRQPDWTKRIAVAGLVGSVVILGQELPGAGSAGVLLAAGATLAVVGRHPLALLAMVPGATGVIEAISAGREPEHAAATAALIALALAALAGRTGESADDTAGGPSGEPARSWSRPPRLALVAAAFGLVPVWTWSGAEVDVHLDAVAVVVAVGSIVVVLRVVAFVRRAGFEATVEDGRVTVPEAELAALVGATAAPGTTGSVERSPALAGISDHARTQPTDNTPAGPPPRQRRRIPIVAPPEREHTAPEQGEGFEPARIPTTTEPAVAVSPEPVPRRPPVRRRGGGSRLRAGAGGTSP